MVILKYYDIKLFVDNIQKLINKIYLYLIQ